MQKETVYYVEYLYHGLLFTETSRKKISNPDPLKVKRVDNAYGFNLFEQEVVKDGDNVYEGKLKYIDKQYFFEGEIYSLEQIKKHYPKEDTLIWNMETNKIPKVIKIGGRFYPFNKECVLLG